MTEKTAEKAAEMNIYQRIAAAYKDIAAETFEKSGTVGGSGGGYNFIPIGQILNIVRRAHGKHGIIVMFGSPMYDAEQGEKRDTYTKETKDYNGNVRKTTWSTAVGHIHVRIYGSSEDDCIENDVPFEAQDNSDKLTNKIITNAERCLYRTLYAIDEGGDDPEATNDTMDNITPVVKKHVDDSFFKKKAEPEPDFVSADHLDDNDIDTFLAVKAAMPKFKDLAKGFLKEHEAASLTNLSEEEKNELVGLIKIMGGA